MSNPNNATIYNLFEDRGDGRLYLVDHIQSAWIDLPTAQRAARAYMASDLSCNVLQVVVVRNEYTEVERVDRDAAADFLALEKITADNENIVAFPSQA